MKSASTQTYVDAARIACALGRFHRANGQLPDTLDTLAPRFINKIPTDVMDGHPLRYRLATDGGYIVYSVGWNETDDGGTVGTNWWGRPGDLEKGDWVWRVPAK